LVDGEKIEADIVIVGIGVKPNTALASSVGLEIENGVKTDAYGQTSRPSIWAAGDCASFPYKSTRCRLESVGHAIDHGQCVAANILGENTPYVAKPWFWSDQYDIKLQIVGLNHGFDDAVSRLDNGVLKSVWYYRGEQLLSVECMNDPRSYVLAKTALHADMNIPKSAAKDPEADLKSAIVDAST
jgi:3-phenylpropionate/trans-cinnamate dioxygenase ferredoxin reductase subunit